MKLIFFLTILSANIHAQALQCDIYIATDDGYSEESFYAPSTSSGHNVPEMTVSLMDHKITAMADGKWLGLNWTKGEEVIAESISLLRDVTAVPRVLMIYNPKNFNEVVSLTCSD